MKDEIVKALLQSVHADGDRLPSVRDLMKSLDAASATVQRALRELSKHRIIYTVPGKGCFGERLRKRKSPCRTPPGTPFRKNSRRTSGREFFLFKNRFPRKRNSLPVTAYRPFGCDNSCRTN